ncbi:MerR family transcriptional regulator [Thalassoroseus pseudoceratinae]|uniref:MerR family transcriptional regulator n=1 Tax=Thalassoroseus pseudoceratinae TaxID=2713176 RepID=UPI001F10732D|nr:tetratricopeptide repeat protein [Thalassoroseus pseudoceratinae]
MTSSPPLQGELVAFTGTLASMTHREACELVEQNGGSATEHVAKQTTMLVVGDEGCPLDTDGQPTQRLVRFLEWQQRGAESRLVAESDWLRLIGLTDPSRQTRRLCTSETLSQLLNVSVSMVRRWERVGLIRPVKKVFRLAYFDFSEVSAARRLSELLEAGVSSTRLKASLEQIRELLPHVDRPLAQLEVLMQNRTTLLYRDDAGLIEPVSRQRYFDFTQVEQDDSPATLPGPIAIGEQAGDQTSEQETWTAERWFQEGCDYSDSGDLPSAINAFRLCLMEQATDPVVHFHLAETLYRAGQTAAARERYYAALEHDSQFIEAWTQLGCVLEETGETESALMAFDAALDIHSEYPDAHRHKAALLDGLRREDESRHHWQAYLDCDPRGPWAQEAKDRLQQIEHEE